MPHAVALAISRGAIQAFEVPDATVITDDPSDTGLPTSNRWAAGGSDSSSSRLLLSRVPIQRIALLRAALEEAAAATTEDAAFIASALAALGDQRQKETLGQLQVSVVVSPHPTGS